MLDAVAREQLAIRVLDSLGCALAAVDGEPVRHLRAQVDEFGCPGPCTLIGGGTAAPDRAALYNTALVRYLDFMDAFMAQGETCHPSDNFGSLLAAADYAGSSGRDVLTALALAYHVQCRLTEAAPVMEKSLDHVAQLAFSIAAGVARLLGMDERQTTNALALCGCQSLALTVSHASPGTNWKGLASSATALSCVSAIFLARRGVTGPAAVFEGVHGFKQATDTHVDIVWDREELDAVTRTNIKQYNAEAHSQSALEGLLDLRREYGFSGAAIARIEVGIFQTAYDIIGGGTYGDRTDVQTKEQADHSLPYLLAVAALDGDVWPAQFAPERMRRDDVQTLLRRVAVHPVDAYTRRYPAEMPCRVTVTLYDGRTLSVEKSDYAGFRSRPVTWEVAVAKFERLTTSYVESTLRREIVSAVRTLDSIPLDDLTLLLRQMPMPARGGAAD